LNNSFRILLSDAKGMWWWRSSVCRVGVIELSDAKGMWRWRSSVCRVGVSERRSAGFGEGTVSLLKAFGFRVAPFPSIVTPSSISQVRAWFRAPSGFLGFRGWGLCCRGAWWPCVFAWVWGEFAWRWCSSCRGPPAEGAAFLLGIGARGIRLGLVRSGLIWFGLVRGWFGLDFV
jgi:hypothetical protein